VFFNTPSAATGLTQNCSNCGRDVAAGSLVCGACHALVNKDQLEEISKQANALEKSGQPRQAREKWLTALPLLPGSSRQAQWIIEHTRALDAKSGVQQSPDQVAPKPENPWAKRLGPVGPIAVLLAKGKGLLAVVFKLKFLLSFFAFFGFYWAAFGWKFGIGFATLILIHEMGHFIDIKRRGLSADMPVFLPGFGAYVRWTALGVTTETRSAIGMAGPMAGMLASFACMAMWWHTGDALWAALARAGAFLNLLNLIPVWVLDGGTAVLALDKVERFVLLTACLVFYFTMDQGVFLLVALGAAYQSFFGTPPVKGSRFATFYYLAVLAGLGLMLKMLPGQGFGN
jgi:Zn-dependent protease